MISKYWCATAAVLCALLPLSCKKPDVDGAFFVDVVVSKNADARCVVLEMTEQNVAAPVGPRRVELVLNSTPKSRTESNGDTVYSVDIRQDGLAPDVSIAALSRTEDCKQPAGQLTFNGESVESAEAKLFSIGKAATLYVGTPCVASGPELCFDGIDNDCKNGTDCQDMVACTAGAQCGNNGGPGATCQMGTCVETNCSNSEDDDRDGLKNCEDSDCNLVKCSINGTCKATSNDAGIAGVCIAPREDGLCDDGQDNDGDNLVDCADSIDCPANSACSDSRSCTKGDTCGGNETCTPGVIDCPVPDANACQSSVTPTCDLAAGGTCVYVKAAAGTACDDKNPCSTSSTCSMSGTCTARTFVACNSPPPGGCFEASGMCQMADGKCSYAFKAVGVDCSTPNSCTVSQSCDGAGVCSQGTPKVCPAQTECKNASTCANGTCGAQSNRPDFLDCENKTGLCLSGACVPKAVTSNVTVTDADLNTFTSDLTIGAGSTCTINTTLPLSIPSCLGSTTVSRLVSINQTGAGTPRAVVLFVRGLTVNGTLRAVGEAPLIVVAKHFIEVGSSGVVDVSSDASGPLEGAGARTAVECGFIGSGGTTNDTAKISSGGSGGSFGSKGGNGGSATNNERGDITLAGGTAGEVSSNTTLTPLVGGCSGGDGGNKSTAGRGAGARAGGALQFFAGARVTIFGKIVASAAAGTGGSQADRIGGGGGGSGGAMYLEAAIVRIENGTLIAMGSGGGAGINSMSGSPTNGNGEPGRNDGNVAVGGFSSSASTNGSGGASAGLSPSTSVFLNAEAGKSGAGVPGSTIDNEKIESITGGGGGGGVGIIRVKSNDCNFVERSTGYVTGNAQGTCPR